ncbi:hypothetical protein [Oceanidesulfovibrio marinus]|uniref:hypothetical protein n=1 Tax=Oceanidesulfovibrio marinus TaxID=370038 RepID=UPI0012946F3D|nr:hypothetical protein [Oceanidesulfovibrio marinus]
MTEKRRDQDQYWAKCPVLGTAAMPIIGLGGKKALYFSEFDDCEKMAHALLIEN